MAQHNNIEDIWRDFFETRNDHYRSLLAVHYFYIVNYMADRIYAKLTDKVKLDDLISAGIFGLMSAIDAFDSERSANFETYCAPRIRGSILDELRQMDRMPRLVRARADQFEIAVQALKASLVRVPTDEEVARKLQLGMDEFRRLRRDANTTGIISLSSRFNDSQGKKNICEVDISKGKKNPNSITEAQKRKLKELTNGLTRAERLIIIMYYYDEMTIKEIGDTLDLSESRVSLMHSSIIARLKAQMNMR